MKSLLPLIVCLAASIGLAVAERRAAMAAIARTAPANQSDGSIGDPVLGIVSAASGKELRPMQGVAAASELGSPLETGVAVTKYFVSPSQGWVLAETDGPMITMQFDAARLIATAAVENRVSKTQAIAFSPSGRIALVLGEGRLVAVSPSGQTLHEWPSPPERVRSLAIDDSGTVAVIAVEGGAIFVLNREGAAALIHRADGEPTLTFLANSETLLVSDPTRGALLAIQDVVTGPALRVVAEELPTEAAFLASSSKGDFAVMAFPESAKAARIKLSDASKTWLDLPTRAIGLQRLRNGDAFLLTAEEGEPAWWISSAFEAVFAGRKEEK